MTLPRIDLQNLSPTKDILASLDNDVMQSLGLDVSTISTLSGRMPLGSLLVVEAFSDFIVYLYCFLVHFIVIYSPCFMPRKRMKVSDDGSVCTTTAPTDADPVSPSATSIESSIAQGTTRAVSPDAEISHICSLPTLVLGEEPEVGGGGTPMMRSDSVLAHSGSFGDTSGAATVAKAGHVSVYASLWLLVALLVDRDV